MRRGSALSLAFRLRCFIDHPSLLDKRIPSSRRILLLFSVSLESRGYMEELVLKTRVLCPLYSTGLYLALTLTLTLTLVFIMPVSSIASGEKKSFFLFKQTVFILPSFGPTSCEATFLWRLNAGNLSAIVWNFTVGFFVLWLSRRLLQKL